MNKAFTLEKKINKTLEHCFNEMDCSSSEKFIEIARKHDCSKQILEYMYKCILAEEGHNYTEEIIQKLIIYETTHNASKDITLKCFSYIMFGTKCTDNVIQSKKYYKEKI